MSWPADNKSDITRLDNANDTLGRSRREIKRGIDNVNSILDEFDINSVDAFTILQYKSGQWKPVDTTSLGMKTAIIETNLDTAANINVRQQPYFNVLFDPFNITSTDSALGNLFLTQGTYYFEQQGEFYGKTGNTPDDRTVLSSITITVDGNSASEAHQLVQLGDQRCASAGTTSHVATVDSTSTGRIDATLTNPHNTRYQKLSWIIYKLA